MYTSTTTTLLFAALSSITAALPTTSNLAARAGGPIAKPIPDTCTVTHPLPTPDSTSHIPAPATDNALFYYAYYPSPSSNKTALSQQCLEQCYGYGDSTMCKGAFWAENVPVPAGYYGSPGGQLNTACLFFNRTLESDDFMPAPEGQATDAFAANIAC